MTTAELKTDLPNPAYSSAVQSRYKDAYLFAKSCINAGDVIKLLAAIVAVICIVLSCVEAYQSGNPGVAVGGILVGGLVGLGIYIFGILIAALGQVLIALLDTALNTSPYLDNDTRAEAMSLVSRFRNRDERASSNLASKSDEHTSDERHIDEAECPWCKTKGAETVQSDYGIRLRCSNCSREYDM